MKHRRLHNMLQISLPSLLLLLLLLFIFLFSIFASTIKSEFVDNNDDVMMIRVSTIIAPPYVSRNADVNNNKNNNITVNVTNAHDINTINNNIDIINNEFHVSSDVIGSINNINNDNDSNNNSNNNITEPKLVGFLIDYLDEIAEIANFQYNISEVKDGKYGYLIEDVDNENIQLNWTGLVGELVRNETDLALAPLVVCSDRLTAIDFTLPFDSFQAIVVYRESFYWGSSSITSSISSSGSINSSGDSSSSSNSSSGDSHSSSSSGSGSASTDSSNYSDGSSGADSSMSRSGSSSFGKSGKDDDEVGGKITSVEDLIYRDKYNFGAVRDGSIIKYLSKYRSNHVQNSLFKILDRNPLQPPTVKSGLTRVMLDANYAFLVEEPAVRSLLGEKPCDFKSLPTNFYKRHYALATRKNSPLRDRINSAILEIIDSGRHDELVKKWWKDECSVARLNAQTMMKCFVCLFLTILTLVSLM
ncbi:hypothetical protein HELRODRAFT_190839 [Helobdella robusta]|uniref:Ionotropic glutamate receptor L-glutamate and glycine-binding domain-containing protein n=1 Tax=Helobdella robusta TaxID=6412 RepID=T1FSC8_HELRO|nr:hypothetical protein HELRODRAFT_190839 [Helobdella robusta]ESO07998.1 hypothetical protein HELRODRAFT_190839 [Helobdella robusta]